MALQFGEIEVDLDAFEVRRDGEVVHVEPQVFDVLRYLIEHRDRLVPKQELLEQVWGTRFVSESALTSRIKAARRAIGDDGREQRMIRTVHGRGYRFVAPTAELSGAALVDDSRPATPGARPVLLERDDALRTLDDAVGDAARGDGRVVLVAGEAGIGKSSLVRAFVTDHPSTRVMVGTCDDLVTPRPLGPFHDLTVELPTIGAALADQQPAELHRVVLEELRRPPSPAVLVVEDAHWADEATIDVLTVVTRRIAGLPAVLMLTFRDREVVGSHPLVPLLGSVPPGHVRHITLGALSTEAVAELVGRDRADEVMAVSGGLPFFVTELAALDPARWHGLPPPSVAHAVRARLARLPTRTTQLLDLLAVEPSRTDAGMLDRLRPGWVEDIEPAERTAMVRVSGASVNFRHELARRAVLDALPAGRLRSLHHEVAITLAEAGADPARVVHHAEAAGDEALLVDHALVAARSASAVEAHREAWSHYCRVVPRLGLVAQDQHGAVLEEASREAYATGDIDAALTLASRSLECWREAGDAIGAGRLHRWLSRIQWFEGRRTESEVQARLAVKLLEPLPASSELAWAYSNLSQLAMLSWRRDDASRWGSRAIELATAVGDDEALVHALINVAADHDSYDRWDQRPMGDAIAKAKAGGFPHEATRGMITVAYTAIYADWPGPATTVTHEALRYAEQFEVETLRQYLAGMLGLIAVLEGRWQEADSILTAVMTSAVSVTRMLCLTALALLRVRRGDDTAAATLDQAWPPAEAAGEPQRIVPLAAIEAEHAWLCGRLDPSTRHLLDGYAMAVRVDGSRGRLARWLFEAGALGAPPTLPEPHRAELEGRWQDAADDWARRGMPYEQALAVARTGPTGRHEALEIAERLGAQPLLKHLRSL